MNLSFNFRSFFTFKFQLNKHGFQKKMYPIFSDLFEDTKLPKMPTTLF